MIATVSFEEDLTHSFHDLRTTLRGVMDSVGVDATAPGELARQLGLNRNLTWKLAKFIGTTDLFAALQHLPGDEGIEIATAAMKRVGAPDRVLDRFAKARARLDEVIRVHAGDRATMELILDSMGGAGSGDRLEQSRKLAFRGNSGLWGLQARVRTTTTFIAPSRTDPELLDLAIVGGVVDFRRLRPGIRWPLFRPRQYQNDGTPIVLGPNEEAIDPASNDPSSPMLIHEFCSDNLPEIRAVKGRMGVDYEMGDGPVGNLGAFTCYFGRIVRRGPCRYHTSDEPYVDLLSHVTMPVETMIFDLIVHQELAYLMKPRVMLLASTDGVGPGNAEQSIPLEARPTELSGRPPLLGTPLVPRYDELTAMVFRRGGWNPRDFRALRIEIKYPPMHAVTVLRGELPKAPVPGAVHRH